MSTSVELALWENYMKAGQWALSHKNAFEAETMFSLALKKSQWLEPEHTRESVRWLVMSCCEGKSWQKAEKAIIEYLEFHQEDADVTDMSSLLSHVYERQGKVSKACHVLQSVLQPPMLQEQFSQIESKCQLLRSVIDDQEQAFI